MSIPLFRAAYNRSGHALSGSPAAESPVLPPLPSRAGALFPGKKGQPVSVFSALPCLMLFPPEEKHKGDSPMLWKNEEQYSDYTAGEAMFRVLSRHPDDPGAGDDTGCRLLIAAVVRQAVEDHLRALRELPFRGAESALEETTAFFMSDFFYRLTGLRGDAVLRLIRREVKGR